MASLSGGASQGPTSAVDTGSRQRLHIPSTSEVNRSTSRCWPVSSAGRAFSARTAGGICRPISGRLRSIDSKVGSVVGTA
jgi:hypothetical protein